MVFLYAITDRALFPGDNQHRQAALVRQAALWAAQRMDFVQLREKDLPSATLAALARNMLHVIREANSSTKLLINSRADVAVATGAHGVHLTSATAELTPAQIRRLYASAALPSPLVTVSCHTIAEVERACDRQVDAILFGPVFEKSNHGSLISPGQGLDHLRAACKAASTTPVYALGGITRENSTLCLQAGAAGIAGIRIFHNDL